MEPTIRRRRLGHPTTSTTRITTNTPTMDDCRARRGTIPTTTTSINSRMGTPMATTTTTTTTTTSAAVITTTTAATTTISIMAFVERRY